MRFLISRTDAIGDVVVSLPVIERILSREPSAEIHVLLQARTAPMLAGHPGIQAVHVRPADSGLVGLMEQIRPDAILNLYHRDRAVMVAAKSANVPIRVARARGLDQILAATHRLWKGRAGTGRHESQNLLDFLTPFGWDGGWPQPPRLFLTPEERAQGLAELAAHPRPRVGLVHRGSGAGAHPSEAWWDQAKAVLRQAGWHPVSLSPPANSDLPETDLRGLMARLAACDAILSPSTGPAHLAAALGVPLLVLIGLRKNHAPNRWSPMGERVQVLQYPGPEADLTDGMDRIPPEALVSHLDRLR